MAPSPPKKTVETNIMSSLYNISNLWRLSGQSFVTQFKTKVLYIGKLIVPESNLNFQRRETHPEISLLILIPRNKVLKLYCAISVEDIVDRSLVKNCYSQRICIFHFVNKRFVPFWVKCLGFYTAFICFGKKLGKLGGRSPGFLDTIQERPAVERK